ncbi:MAG: phosphotransferase, partial [Actinomycetota bacterium]|nr:phosphotransferase [Actinomycetota bacterium]
HPATPGDQVGGADYAQARSAVVALAELHAPFWGRPRTDEVAWVPGLDTPGTSDALGAAMAASLPRFVDRFGHLLPDTSLDWLHRFVPRLSEWRNDLLDRPLTIAHADYRLENMLFDDEGEITVIDWQTAMYTGGATDLSFFLATNLDIELRRAHEGELVDLYTATLHGAGVSADQTGHVWDDYRTAHLWWMGMLANNLSSIETPDERSQALFDAMLTRLHTAAVDVDSGAWLEGGR